MFLWIFSAQLDAFRPALRSSILQLAGKTNSSRRNWDMFQKIYLPLLGLCWVLFQFDQALAGRTLLIFGSTIVVLLTAISMIQGGKLAMWPLYRGHRPVHLHRLAGASSPSPWMAWEC